MAKARAKGKPVEFDAPSKAGEGLTTPGLASASLSVTGNATAGGCAVMQGHSHDARSSSTRVLVGRQWSS